MMIGITISSLLFAISTVLIVIHVLYGGYFLYKKENRFDAIALFFAFLIFSCLLFIISNITRPLFWFLGSLAVFSFAMPLHFYYRSRIKQVYLQEFCNYKLYIEVYAIILLSIGVIFYCFFPEHKSLLGALSLIFILRLNLLIFSKKKLYRLYYQPADTPELPFVSIVIAAYNEEEYIGKLLESIKSQGYPRFEVIVVDDHSTDRTVEIAKGFEANFALKVVQKDIRGVSRSRNYGASFAQGDIILFLDADVVMHCAFISDNIKAFREERLSVAGVDFIPITENKIDKWITGFYRIWLKVVQYFNPRGIGFCLFVYNRLHKEILFDESIIMSEDFDYVKRAAERGKFRIINTVLISVSWRRFHKENRILLVLKYLFFEWYRQHIGEIRKKMLPYEFGGHAPSTK